jgi:hypothetical protein
MSFTTRKNQKPTSSGLLTFQIMNGLFVLIQFFGLNL